MVAEHSSACIANSQITMDWLTKQVAAAASCANRCCCCFRVKLGPGGMDALVTLGGGDMRRTLNILQVIIGTQHPPHTTRIRVCCLHVLACSD
jgi:hypothetical protein